MLDWVEPQRAYFNCLILSKIFAKLCFSAILSKTTADSSKAL